MLLVWGLLALLAVGVLVTYSRLPPTQLYNVSRDGLEGGLSRLLVLTNYPIALASIGVVAVLLERGATRLLGAAAIALCAVTAWPGVVEQSDLDARPVNLVPAAGVGLAVALTALSRPRTRLAERMPLDRARIALSVALVIVSVPWLFAESGFFAPDPIYADEVPPGETLAAVHLGSHHGTAGTVLALSALLLSRVARTRASHAVLALMFVYGVANAAQDFWLEQVVKRGWVDASLPSMIVPKPSVAWLVILGASAVLWLAAGRPRRTG